MTMKTSCISPPQWSNCEQHFSTPAVTKAFAWVVSSETACAIWFLLDPKWVSVTRVLRFGVVRYVYQQRLEVTGKYIHNKEIVSIVICLTVMTEGKRRDRSPPVACRDVPHGLSDVAIGCWQTEAHQRKRGGGDGDGVRGDGGQRRQLPHRTGLPRQRPGLRVRPGLQRHCAC